MEVSRDVSDSLKTVAHARRMLNRVDWKADETLLQALLTDGRAGIRWLGERVLARRAELEAEEERLRRELISTSEGVIFAEVIEDMVAQLKKIGPSPFKKGQEVCP